VLVSADDPTELFRSTSVGVVGASVREAHATVNPLVIRTVINPVRRFIVPRVEPQALAATDDHRTNANEPQSNSCEGRAGYRHSVSRHVRDQNAQSLGIDFYVVIEVRRDVLSGGFVPSR
jgi:hypothetical protein